MHWIIQNNIYAEEGFESLINALTRLNVPYSTHKVIPFVGELEGEIPPSDKYITMGSYSLARQAVKRGWKPGAFLDNLDFEIQRKHWGARMFNYDATISTLDKVTYQFKPFFIRPVGDSKAFTGCVMDWGQFTEWRDGLRRMGPETADPVNDPLGVNVLTLETPVMVCSKKEILNETRFWIVDGRVVTYSGYKFGTIKRYTTQVDPFITDYAQWCADTWCPNDAFVLDVFYTEGGPKIGEVNNLNSAGFYKGDMNKLVMALEEYANK